MELKEDSGQIRVSKGGDCKHDRILGCARSKHTHKVSEGIPYERLATVRRYSFTNSCRSRDFRLPTRCR
jgi:hypothetical protein